MDKQTKATLTQSAQHMAEGLKIMNPPAVEILQLEAYTLGLRAGQDQMNAKMQNIINTQARLIALLTAKLEALQ